jgi:hypothetical protein
MTTQKAINPQGFATTTSYSFATAPSIYFPTRDKSTPVSQTETMFNSAVNRVEYVVDISGVSGLTGGQLQIVGQYPTATLGTYQELGIPQMVSVTSGGGTPTVINDNTASTTAVINGQAFNCNGVTAITANGRFVLKALFPSALGCRLKFTGTAGTATLTVRQSIVADDTLRVVSQLQPIAFSLGTASTTSLVAKPIASGKHNQFLVQYEAIVAVTSVGSFTANSIFLAKNYPSATNLGADTLTAIPAHYNNFSGTAPSIIHANTASGAMIANGLSRSATGATAVNATTGLRIFSECPIGDFGVAVTTGTGSGAFTGTVNQYMIVSTT